MPTVAIRMPKYPECWHSCGNCASGDVFVLEVLVGVGDHLLRDDNILTLETGKVALDIPSPQAGQVLAVHVCAGDHVAEHALLLTLQVPATGGEPCMKEPHETPPRPATTIA